MKILLIILALILILLNFISVKSRKNDNKQFNKILDFEKDNIENYKIEIGRLKRELSETIIDLQREIYDLKEEVEILKNQKLSALKKSEDNNMVSHKRVEEVEIKYDNLSNNINNTKKTISVEKLLNKGKSDEEICEILKIGKGELLLIKGLYNY